MGDFAKELARKIVEDNEKERIRRENAEANRNVLAAIVFAFVFLVFLKTLNGG